MRNKKTHYAGGAIKVIKYSSKIKFIGTYEVDVQISHRLHTKV